MHAERFLKILKKLFDYMLDQVFADSNLIDRVFLM